MPILFNFSNLHFFDLYKQNIRENPYKISGKRGIFFRQRKSLNRRKKQTRPVKPAKVF